MVRSQWLLKRETVSRPTIGVTRFTSSVYKLACFRKAIRNDGHGRTDGGRQGRRTRRLGRRSRGGRDTRRPGGRPRQNPPAARAPDVVKIEPPDGDPARTFGRMLGIEDGVSPPFEMDNRSKRSIVLDLASDDGRETAFELLSSADVFVTNIRPGALARIGLDFEAVAARNPR